MDEAQIDQFRREARMMLVERIALRALLLAPVAGRALSIEDSAEALEGWLDVNREVADRAYGEHLKDPAMAALFSDEMKAVIDDMKAVVRQMADEWKARINR